MLTREEILEIYEAGPEAVITAFQRLESNIDTNAKNADENIKKKNIKQI
jgi:hypothetical protein